MARTIAEANWKAFKRMHSLALERFCERVLAEIEQVTKNGMQSAHQRYVDIFRIVEQRDREIARLFHDQSVRMH
jgi:predicted secreted Zn-dependent protease